jgi:hypothetical protein
MTELIRKRGVWKENEENNLRSWEGNGIKGAGLFWDSL